MTIQRGVTMPLEEIKDDGGPADGEPMLNSLRFPARLREPFVTLREFWLILNGQLDCTDSNLPLEERLAKELLAEDDLTAVRVLNLPSVMCHSANGETYLVDTRYSRHRKRRVTELCWVLCLHVKPGRSLLQRRVGCPTERKN